MKKIFIITCIIAIAIILIYVGGKNKEIKSTNESNQNVQKTQDINNTEYLDELKKVLYNKNKLEIKDENEKVYNGYINNFEYYSKTFEIKEYVFIDLDGDKNQEVVALTDHDIGLYIILHYENEKIYGYAIGIRTISQLKEDGTFIGSNGVNSKEYSKITFDKDKYAITTIASFDGDNEVYKINDKSVSKTEIEDYMEAFNNKKSVKFEIIKKGE